MQDIDGALETLVATQEHIRAHKDVETQKVSTATYIFGLSGALIKVKGSRFTFVWFESEVCEYHDPV
jgi:hypothetical protein